MKRGICPIPLPADVCGEETDDECSLDSDCFGDMKCCSDSCQKLCVQPPQSKIRSLFIEAYPICGPLSTNKSYRMTWEPGLRSPLLKINKTYRSWLSHALISYDGFVGQENRRALRLRMHLTLNSIDLEQLTKA